MACYLWLVCAFHFGCATLTPSGTPSGTPGGAGVSVYQAPLDTFPAQRSMPGDCRLVATKPPATVTELDLEGQKDPFRQDRNDASAAGANALLVLKRMIVGRRDSECTVGLRITDCPPSFGAWYRVVIESYACPPEELNALSLRQTPSEQDLGRIDVRR
jgi:hypothetical protein